MWPHSALTHHCQRGNKIRCGASSVCLSEGVLGTSGGAGGCDRGTCWGLGGLWAEGADKVFEEEALGLGVFLRMKND